MCKTTLRAVPYRTRAGRNEPSVFGALPVVAVGKIEDEQVFERRRAAGGVAMLATELEVVWGGFVAEHDAVEAVVIV